jgi:hypothetical protein
MIEMHGTFRWFRCYRNRLFCKTVNVDQVVLATKKSKMYKYRWFMDTDSGGYFSERPPDSVYIYVVCAIQNQVVFCRYFSVPGGYFGKNHLEQQNIGRKPPESATT